MSKKIEIQLNEWDSTCGDGCCFNYGVEIVVNNVKLEEDGTDTSNAIEAILVHLGYEVEIKQSYNL
jgi:hypothetical protein